jgi:peptide/nickel transport system substrate-binding protein
LLEDLFFHPHAGGFVAGSPFHNFDDSIYYAYNVSGANSILDGLGLEDSDGNGIRNLPNGGDDLVIDVLYNSLRSTDNKLADASVSMFEAIGIKPVLKPSDNTDAFTDSGNWSMYIAREHWVVATKNIGDRLPTTSQNPAWHRDNEGDLLAFEETLVDKAQGILSTNDLSEVASLARDIQRVRTENVYTVGLIQAPAALLINKRIKNNHPGAPVYMYEWAEDGVMRSRLYTPKADQLDEFLPGVLAEY